MHGKIENGSLTTAGSVLYTETEQIFNATEEMWLANGWKLIIQESCEKEDAIPVITETETNILISWE